MGRFSQIREDDGMSMRIGGNNTNVKRIEIKGLDGVSMGSVTIIKTKEKKKKRLQYNFKKISTKIMMSKTSGNARKVVSQASVEVARLQRQQKSGDYDDRELRNAIIHARKLARIAKKREKNLAQEEKAQRESAAPVEIEKNTELVSEEIKEIEKALDKEEMRENIRELTRLMEEQMAQLQAAAEELTEEVTETLFGENLNGVQKDMKPEDLERLKKKHRAEELRDIMEADMKYLKSMINRLERERQENAGGVSLQLDGIEIPVEIPAEALPIMEEGGNVDVYV